MNSERPSSERLSVRASPLFLRCGAPLMHSRPVSRRVNISGRDRGDPAPRAYFERPQRPRSEEHTSELQSLMRISYAVSCLKKKNTEIYQSTFKHEIYHTY